jgi:uncharacterized protein YkwD
MNQKRAEGADCPEHTNDPMGPLTMVEALREVSQLHSWDLTSSSYFSHYSCNGRDPFQRANQNGTYAYGEIIAGNYFMSAEQFVNQWQNSQGHCELMLSPSFSEIGIGFARAVYYHTATAMLR